MRKIFFLLLIPFFLLGTNYKKIFINNNIPTILQCPTSKSSSCSFENFINFQNQIFYFYMCGKNKRNELRFLDEFKFKKNTDKILAAKVEIVVPNEEFTFLQIHTDKGINKPVLRIAIIKNKLKLFVFNGKKYIKYTVKKFKNIYQIIGKKFFIKIHVKDNILNISIKNSKGLNKHYKIKIYDKKEKMYFKIGVYLQKNGCANVNVFDIKYY